MRELARPATTEHSKDTVKKKRTTNRTCVLSCVFSVLWKCCVSNFQHFESSIFERKYIPAFSWLYFHFVLSWYPPTQHMNHIHMLSHRVTFLFILSSCRMSVVFLSFISKHWMLKRNWSLMPQISERCADSKCPWQLTGLYKAPASSLALPQPSLPANRSPNFQSKLFSLCSEAFFLKRKTYWVWE